MVDAAIGAGLHYSEYCTPAQPDSITAGPDGAVWFLERDRLNAPVEKIGRIAPGGVIKEYEISGGAWYGGFVNEYGSAITAGPDGALWFIGVRKNDIVGRITTSGDITTYPSDTPTQLHQLMAIAPGPDGALWFAALNGEVGRVTTSGVVSTFQCVTCLGHSTISIASGPDGDLWFTSYGEILRMSTSGIIDLQRMAPRTTVHANSITLGTDGAMWFTQYANAIGRVTPSRAFTNFPVPPILGTSRGVPPYPIAITAGPDGAMWFSEPDNKIGRMTTSGALTEYAIEAMPSLIISGPDRAIWFVESGNKIGRVSLD